MSIDVSSIPSPASGIYENPISRVALQTSNSDHVTERDLILLLNAETGQSPNQAPIPNV
jgi:hypothetical protein